MLKVLSIFYWFAAVLTLIATWFGVLMVGADSLKLDWMAMVLGSAITVVFVLGALEGWRNAPQKSLLGKVVLVGPLIITLLTVAYFFLG